MCAENERCSIVVSRLSSGGNQEAFTFRDAELEPPRLHCIDAVGIVKFIKSSLNLEVFCQTKLSRRPSLWQKKVSKRKES